MNALYGPWVKGAVFATLGVLIAEGPVSAAEPIHPSVVDSKGQVVGMLIAPNIVMRQVDGQWIQFQVDISGVVPNGFTASYYSQPNCKGTPYIEAGTLPTFGAVIPDGAAGATTGIAGTSLSSFELYFPKKPFVTLTVGGHDELVSYPSVDQDGKLVCGNLPATYNATALVGEATSVTLKFSPPFSIK